MKRLMIVAAMLAMVLVVVVPAQAETPLTEDQYGPVICVDGVDGGVCYDPDEPITCEVLGDEAQAFLDLKLGSESDRKALDPDGNGIACDDPEKTTPELTTPEKTTPETTTPEPTTPESTTPDEPDKRDTPDKRTGIFKLPDTGGPALFALGAGGLLISGGFLLRRIFG
jgi:hypothetical protein